MLETDDDRLVKNEVCNTSFFSSFVRRYESLAFWSYQVGDNLTGKISTTCYDNDEAYLQEENTFSSRVVILNLVLMAIE